MKPRELNNFDNNPDEIKDKIYWVLSLTAEELASTREDCEAVEDIYRNLSDDPSEVEIIFECRKYLGLPVFE